MSKVNGGIYSYIGSTNNKDQFNRRGKLIFPSGKRLNGMFANNQLTITRKLAANYNKIGRVIDLSALTQDEFDKNIGKILEYTQIEKSTGTIAFKHHQLQLDIDTANQITDWLKRNKINTVQWLSCGDSNTENSIQHLTKEGIKVVAAEDGQSAIIATYKGQKYFVATNQHGDINVPKIHTKEKFNAGYQNGQQSDTRSEEYEGGGPDEKGTFTWPDGSTYDGEWFEGRMHGNGTYTSLDGKKYDGEWFEGKRHGKGIFTWPDDSTYDGEWFEGRMHGNGTYTWPDGTQHVPSTTYIDLNGSSLSYTPPAGTNHVKYELNFHASYYATTTPLFHLRFYYDGTEVTHGRMSRYMYYDDRNNYVIALSLNNGTESIAAGKIGTWNTAKIIKLQVRAYTANFRPDINSTHYFDGGGSRQHVRPTLTITAIA